MVTNLAGGATSSVFEWGDANGYGLTNSSLAYNGVAFGGIAAGERFQIGTFDYYNGKVLDGTGATSIDLTIDLALDINGTTYNPYFDFAFDLVNVQNAEDPNNPWPDADYVSIRDSRSSRTLVVGDFEYEFRIDFGESTANGFALFDEFHVLEEMDASVNTYGTFIKLGEVNSAPENASAMDGGMTAEGIDSSKEYGEGVDPTSDQVYQKSGYQDVEEVGSAMMSDLETLETSVAEDAVAAAVLADAAESFSQEVTEKSNDGTLVLADAETAQANARAAADEAAQLATDAEAASDTAKLKAEEMDMLASKDPALREEADQAIARALATMESADAARAAADRATAAADEIDGVVAGFSPGV